MTRTAHCSCGALRVEVSADPDAVGVCHCGECQRRTGSVFGVGAFFQARACSRQRPLQNLCPSRAGGAKAQDAILPDVRNNDVLGGRLEARPYRRCRRCFSWRQLPTAYAIGLGGVEARMGRFCARSPTLSGDADVTVTVSVGRGTGRDHLRAAEEKHSREEN